MVVFGFFCLFFLFLGGFQMGDETNLDLGLDSIRGKTYISWTEEPNISSLILYSKLCFFHLEERPLFSRTWKVHTFKSKRIFSELKYLERPQFILLPAAREPCRLIQNEPEKHSFLLARSLQIWPQWRVVLIGKQSKSRDLVAIVLFLRQVCSIKLPLGQDEHHCICSISEIMVSLLFSSEQQCSEVFHIWIFPYA